VTDIPGPPEHLDAPLELTPRDWERRDVYHLLTGLVVPRPIAWVSTLSPTGVRNLAPHSYFTVVDSYPPHIAFSSIGVKDTLTNLRASGEFVCNMVSVDLVEAMNGSSIDAPADVDEFALFGIEAAPSHAVAAPRVAAARAHLECRVVDEVEVGRGHLVIGEVVHIHVDPRVWADGRVRADLLDPVARLAGSWYAPLGELFSLQKPHWEDQADT
jgi:flavin reductase (DIM6/NTAB) family NADH-FMN oxidoreductase RutF